MIRLFFLVMLSLFSSFIFGQKIKFNEINLTGSNLSTKNLYVIKSKRIANYQVLYIGDLKNEITLQYSYNKKENDSFLVEEDKSEIYRKHFKDSLYRKLKIYVDTSRIINHTISENNKFYAAYPVFIFNKSTKPWIATTWSAVNLILQAQTKKGTWQDIENPLVYKCGTGMTSKKLNPQNVLITAFLLTDGDYKTKLRLRYQNLYSNEFDGKIYSEQFLDKNSR
jgi:hypothetical protein